MVNEWNELYFSIANIIEFSSSYSTKEIKINKNKSFRLEGHPFNRIKHFNKKCLKAIGETQKRIGDPSIAPLDHRNPLCLGSPFFGAWKPDIDTLLEKLQENSPAYKDVNAYCCIQQPETTGEKKVQYYQIDYNLLNKDVRKKRIFSNLQFFSTLAMIALMVKGFEYNSKNPDRIIPPYAYVRERTAIDSEYNRQRDSIDTIFETKEDSLNQEIYIIEKEKEQLFKDYTIQKRDFWKDYKQKKKLTK